MFLRYSENFAKGLPMLGHNFDSRIFDAMFSQAENNIHRAKTLRMRQRRRLLMEGFGL